MRAYNLISINCAGSGHAGGTLSVMDIACVLYMSVARHDPKNPGWSKRDRIIWSGGHKAPALYVSLGMTGYFQIEETVTLRKFGSPFQGHPHWLKLPGIEVSTGSLGQGFGVGVGMALKAKLNREKHRIFIITGDGEWNEGSMWEAAMEASNFKLDNLTVIIDRNRLQIDGNTEDVMKLESMEEKLSGFGFEVIEADGHDIKEILEAFKKGHKVRNKPVALLFNTVKGKGVSFMENKAGWHGKAPDAAQLDEALSELGLNSIIDVDKLRQKAENFQKKATRTIDNSKPKFKRNFFWNSEQTMKAEMEPTRFGFGKALAKSGGDERIICLGLDLTESTCISKFYEKNPERKNRFLSMGIAEGGATSVAAGLAREGKLPVMSTYGVFCSQRNADQMRTTVCYGELNVFFAGAHGGISVGPDGATHQSLEEISVVGILPNMNLVVPCDSLETEKATKCLLFNVKGPKYLRMAREATPLVTFDSTPFVFGKANVIRYRGKKDNFRDSFETTLSDKYKNEKEDIAIFSCGPELAEAMRAAYILKEIKGIETRVINVHTVKPLDSEIIRKTASEVGAIITAEEHQKGGFGNLIASVILDSNLPRAPKFKQIGIEDRFGESGKPWELMDVFGLTAEFIADKAIKLLK